MQLKKMYRLSENLNEIKRKSDYRYAAEPMSGEEKTAWIKAVKQWVSRGYKSRIYIEIKETKYACESISLLVLEAFWGRF